ncbi:MAG: helix-turn-helix transcriptional regulator [Clostridia bacterium]|nr:helix-turn-helix transcriptional regulator [Clostridia bacterium]
MNFGPILKKLRLSSGLKQSQVATLMKVEGYVISDWEQGRSEPSLDDFRKLCVIYDVPSDEVLCIDSPEARARVLVVSSDLLKTIKLRGQI